MRFFETETKKTHWYNAIPCPYGLCPSNQPFDGARKPKLKFVQKVAPTVHQYKCKYCGNLINLCIQAGDSKLDVKNPALVGKKPSYMFWR